MNYQEFLKKIASKDSVSLEKMRLAFVMLFVLVFGVAFQSFFSVGGGNIAEKNIAPRDLSASVAEVVKVDQTQGDASAVILDEEIDKKDSAVVDQEVLPVEKKAEAPKKDDGNFAFSAQNSNPDFLPIKDYGVEDIKVNSRSAFAMLENGRVLYENNAEERLPIASLTKLVAGMVVTERLKPDDLVVIDEAAINTEGVAGRFKAGEKIKAGDLIKIMLVVSSNDAAMAFSEHFRSLGLDLVALMNEKAKELGLKNTHFTNPVGFDDKEHYSTAKDYAKIVQASLKNEWLWSVLSIKDEIIKSDEKGVPARRIISSDKLLFKDIWGVLGGKTGFTPGAGGCLMVLFEVKGQNGRANSKVISVVLGAKDNQARFDETEKLIQWVREAYIF